jgi:cysteine desulfurase/selenocysteine lyase
MAFDVERIRADFPTLSREVHGKPLVFLDSAASALTPAPVIDRLQRFYRDEYSNIHRGAHLLSAEATAAYEAARQTVQQFIGAQREGDIVFTRGATEAINLVAFGLGEGGRVVAGDEVVITELEHHSNFLPWQTLCDRVGAKLVVVPLDDDGDITLSTFEQHITERCKLVAVSHISNVLGTILPVAEIAKIAHSAGAQILVDGAQGVVHTQVDVQALDCDYYAFSAHKLYGPTGIGVLYGRKELLDALPPYQVGGGTIDTVDVAGSTYLESPLRFEAGTPHIAGALGLAAAIDYLQQLGMEAIEEHEQKVHDATLAKLLDIKGLRLLGQASRRTGVFSFVIDGIHAADVGALLDQQGIAVRVGHHCAQPVMRRYGVVATTRASLGIYNSHDDVDGLISGLHKAIDLFS